MNEDSEVAHITSMRRGQAGILPSHCPPVTCFVRHDVIGNSMSFSPSMATPTKELSQHRYSAECCSNMDTEYSLSSISGERLVGDTILPPISTDVNNLHDSFPALFTCAIPENSRHLELYVDSDLSASAGIVVPPEHTTAHVMAMKSTVLPALPGAEAPNVYVQNSTLHIQLPGETNVHTIDLPLNVRVLDIGQSIPHSSSEKGVALILPSSVLSTRTYIPIQNDSGQSSAALILASAIAKPAKPLFCNEAILMSNTSVSSSNSDNKTSQSHIFNVPDAISITSSDTVLSRTETVSNVNVNIVDHITSECSPVVNACEELNNADQQQLEDGISVVTSKDELISDPNSAGILPISVTSDTVRHLTRKARKRVLKQRSLLKKSVRNSLQKLSFRTSKLPCKSTCDSNENEPTFISSCDSPVSTISHCENEMDKQEVYQDFKPANSPTVIRVKQPNGKFKNIIFPYSKLLAIEIDQQSYAGFTKAVCERPTSTASSTHLSAMASTWEDLNSLYRSVTNTNVSTACPDRMKAFDPDTSIETSNAVNPGDMDIIKTHDLQSDSEKESNFAIVTSQIEDNLACEETHKSNVSKPYHCDLCPAMFSRLYNYTRHRNNVHTVLPSDKGNSSFACDRCDKVFWQKSDLKRHLLVHTEQQQYKCNICAKKYVRKSDLDVHIRFHKNERPYKCTLCDKAYSQSGDLNRHMRQNHKTSELLQCGHCIKRFANSGTLLQHMQGSHQDVIHQILDHAMSSVQ